MEAKELVKQCLENEKQVAALREEEDKGDEALRQEIYRLKYDVYQPKIEALGRERDEKTNALDKEWEKKRTDIGTKISELSTVIAQVQRIMAFLRLKRKDLTINDEDIKPYRNRYIEKLGLVFDDEFLKIKLFIVENNKPKNKYSLVAFGKSIFTTRSEVITFPYDYGLPTYEGDWYSLKERIIDMPTVEELKAYCAKGVLKSIEVNFKKTKEEYLSILKNYRVDDFVAFLAYKCECGAFYTKWDLARVASSTHAMCPDCGKPMTAVNP